MRWRNTGLLCLVNGVIAFDKQQYSCPRTIPSTNAFQNDTLIMAHSYLVPRLFIDRRNYSDDDDDDEVLDALEKIAPKKPVLMMTSNDHIQRRRKWIIIST